MASEVRVCNTEENFKAGKVASHLSAWAKITQDPFVLQMVGGVNIQFTKGERPPDTELPSVREYKFSTEDSKLLSKELVSMLEKGIVEKCDLELGEINSPIMFRHKKEGKIRVILNLSDSINAFVDPPHFKMENIHSALKLMRPDCWMIKIDLMDAYYSFALSEVDKKLCSFTFLEQKYRFVGVPNGYSGMPYIFTRCMRAVLAMLRSNGINCVGYLDDFAFFHSNKLTLVRQVKEVISVFDSLGFTIKLSKSQLTPVQRLDFLGFTLDSVKMEISPTVQKRKDILELCQTLKSQEVISIRTLSQLIGKLVAISVAVDCGTVFYKRMENIRNRALEKHRGDWDAKIRVGCMLIEDLDWWIKNIGKTQKSLVPWKITQVIYSDSSSFGWGGHSSETVGLSKSNRSQMPTASGVFDKGELKLHINIKELLAAFLCLKSFVKKKGQHIKLYTDSSTTLACINKKGSSKWKLNNLTREIYFWLMSNRCQITAVLLGSSENVLADRLSRQDRSGIEWMLDKLVFNELNRIFKFEIDLFASRLNNQLPKYCSWRGDPNAWENNALTLDWTRLHNCYAFPPFSLIPAILQKIDAEQADMVLIVPLWRGQMWFSQLLRMLCKRPILLPRKKNLLTHPQDPDRVHPLLPKTQFLACRLSGKSYKTKEFLKNLPTLSSNHGGRTQGNNTTRTYRNGNDFVLENHLITCCLLKKLC